MCSWCLHFPRICIFLHSHKLTDIILDQSVSSWVDMKERWISFLKNKGRWDTESMRGVCMKERSRLFFFSFRMWCMQKGQNFSFFFLRKNNIICVLTFSRYLLWSHNFSIDYLNSITFRKRSLEYHNFKKNVNVHHKCHITLIVI